MEVQFRKFLFSFSGFFAPVAGELKDLGTKNPFLYLDFPQVPTWNPPLLAAVPDSARVAAYRFGVSVRLLRNICLWKDIFSMPVLEKLALDELLCGKILPHFRSISENVHDAITRMERIIAYLSGVWAGPNVIGDKRLTMLVLLKMCSSISNHVEQ